MTLASWARRLHCCQGLLLDSIPALILLPLAREHSHWAMRTQWYHSAVMDTAVVKRDMNTTEKERGEDMKSKKRTEGTVEKQNCELHHGERKRQENKDQVKDLKRTKHNWNTLVCSFSYSTWEGRQKKNQNTFTVTPKDTAGIFLYSMAHWCLPCDIYCTMFYVQVEKDGLWLH